MVASKQGKEISPAVKAVAAGSITAAVAAVMIPGACAVDEIPAVQATYEIQFNGRTIIKLTAVVAGAAGNSLTIDITQPDPNQGNTRRIEITDGTKTETHIVTISGALNLVNLKYRNAFGGLNGAAQYGGQVSTLVTVETPNTNANRALQVWPVTVGPESFTGGVDLVPEVQKPALIL